MGRRLEQGPRRAFLDDAPAIHDGDAVADMIHHREVMADQEKGDAEITLEILEKVEDLRLDRDIERAHRLIGDDQARLGDEGASDGDSLALATGEFMRVFRAHRPAEARPKPRTSATAASRRARPRLCVHKGSATIQPTVRRGSSEP